jgi:hypothetical protein
MKWEHKIGNMLGPVRLGGYQYVPSQSNASAAASVYFDELYIVHEKNNVTLQVLQASDYYPFGLSFNQYHRDFTPKFTVVTAKHLENCNYPLAIQVDAEIELYSVKEISAEQISKISALNWLTPICIKYDHGFEYKYQTTNRKHIYTVYNLFHYTECQVF